MQKNKHRVMRTRKVVWYSTKSSPKPYLTLLCLWHTLGHWGEATGKGQGCSKTSLKTPTSGFAGGQAWLGIYLGLKTGSHTACLAASLLLVFTAKSVAWLWVGELRTYKNQPQPFLSWHSLEDEDKITTTSVIRSELLRGQGRWLGDVTGWEEEVI